VSFDLALVWRIMPTLAEGLVITLQLSALAVVLSLVWGLGVLALRLSRFAVLRALGEAYFEIVRNTPVLVQMYFIFFGLAMAGAPLSGFASGLIALTLQNGGYVSEIYRAGLASVGSTQREAGQALGMTPFAAFRIVTFPQAIRKVIPPLTNQFILIVKDTALVSSLSVEEMTFQARLLVDRTAAAYEIFASLALLYLLVTGALALLMRALERRAAIPA